MGAATGTAAAAVLAAVTMIGAAPSQARPAAAPVRADSAEASCTDQWLARREALPDAQRYDRRLADAFGRSCLAAGAPVPIDWAGVQADLAAAITVEYPPVALVPADIDAFCPGYVRATPEQRRDFWRSLAYEVIKPEAGVDAHAVMWEQPLDDAGLPREGGEYSIGLLQLSISNRRPYACDIPTEASLLDPTLNLRCGAVIMSHLAAQAGRIGGDEPYGGVGLARYWSTLRVVSRKPRLAGKRETRQPILAALRELPQCR